jgi:hypothetical protein
MRSSSARASPGSSTAGDLRDRVQVEAWAEQVADVLYTG